MVLSNIFKKKPPLPTKAAAATAQPTVPDITPPDSPRTSIQQDTVGEEPRQKRRDSAHRPRRSPTEPSPAAAFPESPHRTRQRPRRSPTKSNTAEHPLNLPPEQLRRYSAWSTAATQTPSSYRRAPKMDGADTARSGSPPAPATPTTNGLNGHAEHEQAPVPPPHKDNSGPPSTPASPGVDAEVCKAAGNKFFKAREWKKAIEEYSKGQSKFGDWPGMQALIWKQPSMRIQSRQRTGQTERRRTCQMDNTLQH